MRFFSKSTSDDFPATASPSTPTFSPSSSSSTTTVGPARPIRLIYCDEKGKFQMDPEAVSVLHLLKGPLGVVSVCGRALQGKSFILNQLLGRSNGFQVASTHRPCTKGLWLWSTPIKKTALDGSKYNLLLLDSEGIDAYDQTGTYSTQIFSLVVLLSSMFIYNQMGGIDEAALDRLSLVTEMTKHIRVRASGGKTTASELGQFSPIFVWLLRDFYLDLAEDNRKITPRDYLEIALRPVNGGVRDVAAKNEIRESIRALFPDRDCFTLVRPMNSENELQLLDQIPLDNMRPDFKSGLDALTRFVFERTGPKQVGAAVMTGPIFARITQSFLDALNNGAVPTITSSWQSVEEAECERAYDSTSELYVSIFDRTKRPEDAAMREAHEEAVQKAITIFNSIALDVGPLGVQLECREEDQRREQEMRLENAPELVTNEEIVKEAWEIVNDSFLGSDRWSPESWLQKKEDILSTSLPTRSKAHDVIRRMLSSLGDPYTRFLSPEEFSKMARYDMSGIGVNIREIPDENGEVKLKVLGLILDGPAYTTGVRQGDELLSVNEVNVKGKSAFEALSIIQGPSDTSVNITVKHGNCGPVQSFDVQRQLIAKSPVYYRLEQTNNGKTSVGYVRLKEFNALARKDFVTAMKKLQGMGASVFVLDLRDNLGGLVLEGIEIAKLFLSKGETVIYTAGREPQNVKSILAETGPLITSPVMVLVNKNTASASEIVATALHDNCRAILVGEKTYGKGLIQSVFELRDGSGVMVTVGKYVTPNHLDINENGIDPDYAKLPAWNEASERLSECQKPECQKPECQNPECQKPECQKQQP